MYEIQPYTLNPNLPLHITYNLNPTMPLHIYQIVHPSTLGICRSPEVNCRSVKACFFIVLSIFRCADKKPTFSPSPSPSLQVVKDLSEGDGSDGLGAVVLTGAGRAFSAGGDLQFLRDRAADTPSRNAVIMRR